MLPGWTVPRFPGARWVALLDVDPDLGRGIPDAELALARRAIVARVLLVPSGPWEAVEEAERDPAVQGFYVLDGTVSRGVPVSGRQLPQLLRRGDVVGVPVRTDSTVPTNVRLAAQGDAVVGIVGAEFARAGGRWPSVLGALHRRLALQEQRLAAHGAICQLPRVEQRVLAMLWLLAEDWGTVSGSSIAISLPLTHEDLGRFVGARRPTVSLAMKDLVATGKLSRRDDGTWLLPIGGEQEMAADGATPDVRPSGAVGSP